MSDSTNATACVECGTPGGNPWSYFAEAGPYCPGCALEETARRHAAGAVIVATSQNLGAFPPCEVWVTKASNGDPNCVDVVLRQGDVVLQRERNVQLKPGASALVEIAIVDPPGGYPVTGAVTIDMDEVRCPDCDKLGVDSPCSSFDFNPGDPVDGWKAGMDAWCSSCEWKGTVGGLGLLALADSQNQEDSDG